MRREFNILLWRAPYDILFCWLVIAGAIYVCVAVSFWFYPLAVLLIANRILALSLLCHEGLHGNLSPNKKWNDFLGRYFCAFPSLISFTKYRRLHILHHSSVGSENWDPDRHLYNYFPMNSKSFWKTQLLNLVTYRTAWSFIQYYTYIPELWAVLKGRMRWSQLQKSSDLTAFLIFTLSVNVISLSLGVWLYTQAFLVFPLLLVTQPYVLLMGALQHGPVRTPNTEGGVSRTIIGSKFYMWMLLPLNINYHGEHHYNPSVPHYWLKAYSKKLADSGIIIWKESYRQSLKNLFTPKISPASVKAYTDNKDGVHPSNPEFLPQFESPSAPKIAVH